MIRYATLLATFIFTLSGMSCNETKNVIQTTNNMALAGTYTILTIAGIEISSSLEKIPSITFSEAEHRVSGNGSCNSYFGSYSSEEASLQIGDLGQTEMYCSESIMQVESAFMRALGNTGSYSVMNDVLTLYSKSDKSVLLTAKKGTGESKSNDY